MFKLVYFIFFLIVYTNITLSKDNDYWQQHVNYKIRIILDTSKQLLHGYEILTYTNNSPDVLEELYFHLYPNAYNDSSIMAQEMALSGHKLIKTDEDYGYIVINQLSIDYPGQLSSYCSEYEYVLDKTLLKIKLLKPLYPNQSLDLTFDFTVKVWRHNENGGKGGYYGSKYVISQWYPKPCVYDENGWNIMPYHWLGEFYGEFGDFDVTINVPFSYIVGATGDTVAGNPGWNLVKVDSTVTRDEWQLQVDQAKIKLRNSEKKTPRRVVRFAAENVHDFVWVASKNYVYENFIISNVNLHILHYSYNFSKNSNSVVMGVIKAIQWLDSNVGKFPYSNYLIATGFSGENMEYPMATVIGDNRYQIGLHETCHMYFYSVLANNEQKEAWLDEGLANFLSELITDNYNKKMDFGNSILDKQLFPIPNSRIKLNYLYYYLYSGHDVPISTEAFKNKNKRAYSLNIYNKGEYFFRLLHYIVGKENFIKILQTYYDSWKFKHVNEERFKTICENIYGNNLDWFFNEWLHNTVRVDYAVDSFEKQKLKSGKWKAEIQIKRKSDGIMPVDIAVVTKDKKYINKWDGQSKTGQLTLYTDKEPLNVIIDPKDEILDQNRINNSYQKQVQLYVLPDYPNFYYQPRNKYLITCWPQFWYNDIDHLKFGLKFLGGYLNRYHIIRTRVWYGSQSRQFDYKISFSNPLESVSKNLWYNFEFLKLAGRRQTNVNLHYLYRKHPFDSPQYSFRAGIVSYRLINSDYIYKDIGDDLYIRYWDEGKIVKLFLNLMKKLYVYSLPVDVELFLENSRKFWDSDRNFTKIFGNIKLDYRLNRRMRLNFRTYGGIITGKDTDVPMQEKYYLAEANPLIQFNNVYLRSKGSLPGWLNHQCPGDGNIRGYVNKYINNLHPLNTNKLFGLNVDLIHTVKNKYIDSLFEKLFNIQYIVFFDNGWFEIPGISYKYFADAGFGIILKRRMLGKTRRLIIQFPIWLNHPNVDNLSQDTNQFDFRWIVGLNQLF